MSELNQALVARIIQEINATHSETSEYEVTSNNILLSKFLATDN